MKNFALIGAQAISLPAHENNKGTGNNLVAAVARAVSEIYHCPHTHRSSSMTLLTFARYAQL
jgi:hypothetical protein